MKKYLLFLPMLCVACSAHAYELGTHARLTQQAHIQSVLTTDTSLFRDLGIDDPGAAKPFGETYLDISGGRIEERESSDFSLRDERMPKGAQPDSIQGWLMRGAIREDDYLSNFGAENPQDDPYGTLNRPLRHFYDPVNNEGWSVLALSFTPAPDWAIGSNDSFANPVVPITFRKNHFTIFDARETLFRALTGKDRNWVTVAANKTQRDKYWATTFRALGDVVHLVQDMGQPQHTRNDPHAGKKYDGFATFSGHKSVFEAYIDARAKQSKFIVKSSETNGGVPLEVPTTDLKYTGYPVPDFDDYASYFSTWHLDGADPLQRRGLADYSNRGFFSAGTNFGNTKNYLHPDPDPRSADYIGGFLTTDWKGDQLTNSGAVKVLRGTVPDTLTGSNDRAALSSYGLWDQFLVQGGNTPQYTLTRANYDDMAALLIPRTVAYSAGMINYFFRGRIEVLIDQYSGQSVTLKFVNRSERDTFYNQDGVNELSVVYSTGTTGKVFGTSESTVSLASGDDVSPGSTSSQSYTFTFAPAIPDDAQELKLQLVYRGKLGEEEDAVAAGTIEMTSPGFIFNPSSVPADGIGGSRYIYKEDGQWTLSTEQGLEFGNIDWKGAYVNGKPTEVLSWQGPVRRYFPNDGISGFSPNIYHDGELFSVAPYPVLGAALNKDVNGSSWLVAVCQNGNNDIVLKRPFTKNTSAALFDPTDHPEGWTVLAEFTTPGSFGQPDRPWFFNGSGSEAQTMRKNSVPLEGGLERMKIAIQESTATIQHLGNHAGESPFGSQSGNGCILRYEITGECSGTWQNPTGFKTSELTQDNRYNRSSGRTGSYVVAVDYIDDRETLATLYLDDLFQEVRKLTRNERNEQICYLNNYGRDTADSTSADRKGDALFEQTQSRALSLNSEKISGLIIDQLDFLRSVSWPDNNLQCPMQKVPGDLSLCHDEQHVVVSNKKKETFRRIEFMDLRNGAVLTTLRDTDEIFLSTRDGNNENWNTTPTVIVQQDITTTTKYELKIGKSSKVLYSNSQTNPGGTVTALPTDLGHWDINTLCERASSGGQSGIYLSMSAKISLPLSVPAGSIVSDTSGDVFASVRYQDANGDFKVFNFLSNGDPHQLTGVSDSDATFYPVGLK